MRSPTLFDAVSAPTPSQNAGADLGELLHRAFGHRTFREHQEEVCRAAVDGDDLLLVMPTGAGKSLCYQLPALARGGTALVVSPLIALIEDQCGKLNALGFSAARIHSGLDRSVSRQACADYLNGSLNFLFIAPERLRVPGFPEMLAKRKPALIAIDEAHCISQWGHDFRPDYRMVGQYLPALRPAPVVALTATATPSVQRDILTQLGLTQARKFIHGFRRTNLAIEVTEVPLPMRSALIADLLRDPSGRPAIVYAPARKRAEELAAELKSIFPTAAYHAGLPATLRDSVQQDFLSGKLECVVATIAFGMGIDKANVRTVIHAALPSTVEGYYQEIGRAGRDGLPSRAILMHSYADMRTHTFFLKRDYPPIDDVDRVFQHLTEDPQPLDDIRDAINNRLARKKEPLLDEEAFQKAIEKLFIHGGAHVDFNNLATRGETGWKQPYTRQSDYRQNQLELVQRYVDGHHCRMAALVLHFGDSRDGELRCGLCDFCNPASASARQYREPTRQERTIIAALLDSLRNNSGKSLGKLQKDLDIPRKELDLYLSALAVAGMVTVEDAEWLKDGETILFRKAILTAEGEALEDAGSLSLQIPDSHGGSPQQRLPAQGKSSGRKSSKPTQEALSEALSPEAQQLEQALKAWRTSIAKKLGMPPFVVLHDRTLRAIAHTRPVTPNQLESISGMGPAKLDKYGSQILSVCTQS